MLPGTPVLPSGAGGGKMAALTPTPAHHHLLGGRTQRRLANGHSNSLDSTEDALSSTSTISSISGEYFYTDIYIYIIFDVIVFNARLEQREYIKNILNTASFRYEYIP